MVTTTFTTTIKKNANLYKIILHHYNYRYSYRFYYHRGEAFYEFNVTTKTIEDYKRSVDIYLDLLHNSYKICS